MANIKENFDYLGAMVDCSRNAVMTVPQLKKFFEIIAKMGYNQVMLYIEDTYEVDGEPYFGYLRGRYTQDELKELDDYAFSLGLELVPCMQTLAHLNAIFHWPEYKKIRDADDILLAENERTYQFVENMIATLRKCLRTDKINIGMDEAHMIGRGKYMDLHGNRDKTEILLQHLAKVVEITEKYGFKSMMWSDMFHRIASGGDYYATDVKFDPSIKKMVPDSVTLVYWDYYHTDKKTYDLMLKGTKQVCDRVAVAGGAWKWSGFTAHNDFSIRTTKAAVASCKTNNIRNLFLTMWGDNGDEASNFAMLPTLCYGACLAQGITKMSEIKAKFKQWVGYEFDDFMLLDLPDQVIKNKGIVNPSKYGLYNDCFLGIFDSTITEGEGKTYASFARRLKNASKRTGEFSYLFDTASKLCSALSIKTELGVRTRKMYESGSKEGIDALIADYKKLSKKLDEFYYAYRKAWYTEKKPHGFDVQDIRLGGLMTRIKNCCDRLVDYRDGKIERIPELEEKLLPLYTGKIDYNLWDTNVTVNRLY